MSSEGLEMWSLHLESYPPDMENVTLYCRGKAFQQRYIHICLYKHTHTPLNNLHFYCYKLNVTFF